MDLANWEVGNSKNVRQLWSTATRGASDVGTDDRQFLPALSRQLEHLAEAVAHAVVGIRLHERLVASGLVWKPGVVITASDALEADDDISVIAGAGKPVSAQFAGRDPTPTSPCCASATACPKPATMTMSDPARVGQMVLALGVARTGSLRTWEWSRLRVGLAEHARWKYRQPDPPRHAVSHRAKAASSSTARAACWHDECSGRAKPLVIPMSTIERVGGQLLADGRIRRGYLGVGLHGIRLDEALAASLSLPDRRAIMVVSVDPNGPARTAGVLVGDVIVQFDSEACPACKPFARLTPESVGRSAELKMLRAGQIATARVAIEQARCGDCASKRSAGRSAIAVELSMDDAELAGEFMMLIRMAR